MKVHKISSHLKVQTFFVSLLWRTFCYKT